MLVRNEQCHGLTLNSSRRADSSRALPTGTLTFRPGRSSASTSGLMQANRRIDGVRSAIKDSTKAEATLIRAEFRLGEEVMAARLKHLEEREHS